MDDALRNKLLTLPPKGKILKTVVDTDAFNECDDIFALAWALLSPERLDVQAVYAEPFLNIRCVDVADGMEQSYQEILAVTGAMDSKVKCCRGAAQTYTKTRKPVLSDAVEDLLVRARAASPDDPLYILALGPVSNVASAMMIDPSIIDNIVIVWQGCGVPEEAWRETGDCNITVDIEAARYMVNSGCAIIQVPGTPVSSHLLTSYWELEHYLKGKNKLSDLLLDHYKLWEDIWAEVKYAWTKPLWDIGTVAPLINEDFCETRLVRCPTIPKGFGLIVPGAKKDITPEWARVEDRWDREFPETVDIPDDAPRHQCRIVYNYSRNAIFADMLSKISGDKIEG